MLLLSAPPRIIGRGMGDGPPVVRGKGDQGILLDAQFLDRIQYLSDFMIHVLDECDVGRPLVAQLGFAFLNLLQPVLGGLDGKVGGVVSQVEKERLLFIRRLFLHIIDRPLAEDFGGMPLGLDHLLVLAHPVHATAQMRPVIVHHVPEKAVEEIEAPVVGQVGGVVTQMPLSDHTRVVTRLAHHLGQGRSGWVEESPVAFHILPDHSGRSDQVGVTARHQGCPGGRADRTIRIELIETHAFSHELVDGRGLDILPTEGGQVAVSQVVDQNADDIWFLGCVEGRAGKQEGE